MVDQYKIGEEFQLNGIKLRCEKAHNNCKGCFFQKDQSCLNKGIDEKLGFCSKIFRYDNTHVIFVKVEE